MEEQIQTSSIGLTEEVYGDTTPQYLLHSVHRLLNNIVSEDHLHSRNDEENYPGCNYPGPGSSDLPPPYVFVKPPDENAHVDGKSFVWKQYSALL